MPHAAAPGLMFASAALELHAFGLNVLPVAQGEKRALVSWRRWQREPQTAADVDILRREFPGANVAIVLGGPKLAVVDVETDSAEGDERLRSSGLPVPPTSAFVSPRGIHRLYRALGLLQRRRGILPDVDLLGRGYVVTPPSAGREWRLGLDHLAALPNEWTASSSSPSPAPRLPGSTDASRSVIPVLLATPDLLATEMDPGFLPAVARTLGLTMMDVGRSFRCVLHRDERPSVTLWRRDDGTIHYEDFHTGQTFTLAEVYAARVSGRVRHLRGPELATWKLRLLVDAKLVEPAEVGAFPLPADAPAHLKRVYRGFLHLLACRWLYTPGAPAPFTWKFAAAWSGVTERQAGEAIREMLRRGVIRTAGTHKRVTLFLPGNRGGEET